MWKPALVSLILIVQFGCRNAPPLVPNLGIWRAELQVSEDQVLPFNFNLTRSNSGDYLMEMYNATEIIPVDEIIIKNDSIIIKPPVFEGFIAARLTANHMEGVFVKESLGRVVSFTATFGVKDRFDINSPSKIDVSGIWETEFNAGESDHYMAKGIFVQSGNKVHGTFETTTGDYRYLDGNVDGDSLKLSTFDGAHAFLFAAKATDSSLIGTFYSGNHSREPFIGVRNADIVLPSPDSLTFLKEGDDRLAFSFPDVNGNMVSSSDIVFKDKVLLVQIMGSWCPNCLDETKFYVEYLKENSPDNLAVVALAFEYAKTEEKAFNSIKRLRDRIGVEYPILLAQYGTSDKKRAQEKLPMLNHVLSYPTTIFIDKKGAIRKIHTGFNGPATGDKFILFKKEFDRYVKGLLVE